VGSIAGPTLAIALWLSITFSHREEKQMVLGGVTKHVRVSDLTDNDATLITASSQPDPQPQLFTPFARPSVKTPFDSASLPQSDTAGNVELSDVSRLQSVVQSDTASSMDRAASVSILGRSASEVQGIGLLQDACRVPQPHQAAEQVNSAPPALFCCNLLLCHDTQTSVEQLLKACSAVAAHAQTTFNNVPSCLLVQFPMACLHRLTIQQRK